MKRVAFFTLGCKVNQYETEAMEELFESKGYSIVSNNEKADIYVINTCTVTNLGDRKSRQFIRKAKKINNDSIIAVVGCYAQVSSEEIMNIDEVDVVIGTNNRRDIVELCEKSKKQKIRINTVKDIMKVNCFENLSIQEVKSRTRAYMKIQEGCNQYCSYCIIPYARGPIRSRSIKDIIEETHRLVNNGFKEVILTGIHVASYGKDLGKWTLLDVIKQVNKIDGIERIRLSSIEPTFITKEFMQEVVKMPKFCNHFHLSLQSGSDTILKKMNRKYTTSQYENIVNIIRKYMPDAGITTDIIVGFPGESDNEFKETYNFVSKIKFSRIHVFKYSPRKGTPASKFKGQINGTIKHERSKKLIQLGQQLMIKFNQKFIGKTLDVLFEEENSSNHDFIEGYTRNYIRVLVKSDLSIKGKILPVKIIKIDKENLVGEIKEF